MAECAIPRGSFQIGRLARPKRETVPAVGIELAGSRTPVTKIIGLLDQWFFCKAGTESEHAMDFKHARSSSDVGTIFGGVCCAADGRYWDFCG